MGTVYDGMPWLKDLVEQADPIRDALRWMGYGFLRMLAKIVDVLFNAIQGLLGINILQIQPVQDFVNSVTPLGWSVLVISLIGGFILLMLYPGRHKGEMARGLLMAVMLMISVPFMFQTLNDFKDAGASDIGNSMTTADKPGETILQASTYDVANSTGGVAKIYSNCDPYYLDINARIPKENSVFSKKIDSVYGDTMYGSDLGDGFFGWGEERLYSYNFSFVEPLFSLVIMLVCLLFTGFKLGRLLFDLVTHQVIAPVVFASDISGAGRSKRFMQSLISNYIVMVMILVLLKIYMDLTTWATTNLSDVWVRILLIAGASWGVIDGPDIILKLIGVDAGVRNGAAVMMGANAAVNLGHSAGGAVSKVTRTASRTTASAAGAVAGGISGIKSMAGNAEMGHGLGSNAQARSDAGIGGLGDMRRSMKSDDSDSPKAGGQTNGYANVPQPKTMGERFSESKNKVSGGIGRTAATVGYVAGKTSSAASSAFRNAAARRHASAGPQAGPGQSAASSHLPHSDYSSAAPPAASVSDSAAPAEPGAAETAAPSNTTPGSQTDYAVTPPVSSAEHYAAAASDAGTGSQATGYAAAPPVSPVESSAAEPASPVSPSASGTTANAVSEPSPAGGVPFHPAADTTYRNTPPSAPEPAASGAAGSSAPSVSPTAPGAAPASYRSYSPAAGTAKPIITPPPASGEPPAANPSAANSGGYVSKPVMPPARYSPPEPPKKE